MDTIINIYPQGTGADIVCLFDSTGGQLQEAAFYLNDLPIARLETGNRFAKNPMLGTHIEGYQPGDRLQVKWIDDSGQSGQKSVTL